jgi:hypothetical protein
MTTLSVDTIGLCAHFSPQGDWAFDLALALAQRREVQLNIFHFLSDPYDPTDHPDRGLSPEQRTQLIIDLERELRFRYDERLGDYMLAGFRLCEDNEWKELHHCLTKREFQVLVLPWPEPNSVFGGRPIAEFANAFVCPVVTVGPGSPYDLVLNRPAAHIVDQLGLTAGGWTVIGESFSLSASTRPVAATSSMA